MKIAILTQPLRTNYGGILQNYALQQCLQDMGHEPYTLDKAKFMSFPFWKVPVRLLKVALGKAPLSRVLYEINYLKDYKEFTKHTRRFVTEHIRLHPYHILRAELSSDSFDAYIVGSDQVWRPDYNDIGEMFLDFTRDWPVKRIAYAASFGTDEWTFSPRETKLCTPLAARFDAVRVREASGIELCSKYLNVSAVHVPDPTMLLSADRYEALTADAKPVQDGGLFVHVLDPSLQKGSIIRNLAAREGLTPFSCNQPDPEGELDTPIELRIQPPVEQWLRSMMSADRVVTDSFHATVFAIILGKRFCVLENPERGLSRIRSLLEMFGLQDCLYSGEGDWTFPEIDYDSVNSKLEKYRAEGLAFLKNALGDQNEK